MTPGPIVVGVERSECSRDALALAGTLARQTGCGLILVAVYPADARSATMERRPYLRALGKAAEAALECAARPFFGIRVQSRAVACNSVARGFSRSRGATPPWRSSSGHHSGVRSGGSCLAAS